MAGSKKALSVFSLVMINIIAVDSLRSLPISAEYGFSLTFFYIVCGLFFLLPVALTAAELATGWPETGGIYVWIREAFGPEWGFLVVWIQWVYNIVWYPTILSLLAATLAFLIDPALATNKAYIFGTVVAMFWFATFVNWFGIRISSWVSTVATILGTLLPIFFIMGLGYWWCHLGKPIAIEFTKEAFLPDVSDMGNFGLLGSVVFGLVGLEMSAVHAGDVQNPQKDYPRAVFISAILILGTLIFGSLAIAMVIPQSQIQLDSGLMDGFAIFFNAFHMPYMIPIIAALIILGGFGTVSAWVLGPSRAIMVAARDGNAPQVLVKSNKHQAPTNVLLSQAIVVTALSVLFIYMPSINAAFALLSTMTAQLALIVYLLMFSAVIRLRYNAPHVERKYRVPGGNLGVWLIAGSGILLSVIVFFVGFIPPSQIMVGSTVVYESILIAGTVLLCLPAFVRYRKNK